MRVCAYSPGGKGGSGGSCTGGTCVIGGSGAAGIDGAGVLADVLADDTGVENPPTPECASVLIDGEYGGGAGGKGLGAGGVAGASDGAMNCLELKGQFKTIPALSSGTVTRRVQWGQKRSMRGIFPEERFRDAACRH